jgi:predicted nucleic acid-binding protein
MSKVLVDTSAWIEFIKNRQPALRHVLASDEPLAHPLVEGELALGSDNQRRRILPMYRELLVAPIATHQEVLALVEQALLFASGIGWIDVSLLASAGLAGAKLLTLDKNLLQAARRLGCAYLS